MVSEPFKAIILAAGKSKRLGPLTAAVPKCLLKLNGRTILQHQLESLARNGIEDITVVTGFCDEAIREHCGSAVHYILNASYETTNSIYSLWLGLQGVDRGVIIMNADVVFHPDILSRLIASPYPDALTVCFGEQLGSEEMKVQVKEHRVVDISKSMALINADGENVGVVKFSRQGRAVLFRMLEKLVSDGVVNAWAPLAFQKICSFHNIYAVSTDGLPWIEIDFPEDLAKARNKIYPRICADPGARSNTG